jgi:hypothetical protein
MIGFFVEEVGIVSHFVLSPKLSDLNGSPCRAKKAFASGWYGAVRQEAIQLMACQPLRLILDWQMQSFLSSCAEECSCIIYRVTGTSQVGSVTLGLFSRLRLTVR